MGLQVRSAFPSALLTFLLLLVASTVASSQPGGASIGTSGGTHYVVAFPDTTSNVIDARYPSTIDGRAQLLIYAATAARVSVRGPGIDTTYTAVAGAFKVIELTGRGAARPIIDVTCQASSSTYRILSDDPVIVYQYMATRWGAEAWTPQPVEAWGKEYFAAAHQGEVLVDIAPTIGQSGWKGRNRMAPAEILVVAAYDDTRITIVPNGQVLNFCRAENVTLRAGEAYQIQSYVDTLTANQGTAQADFGGSRIFSTKPVGVITGNTRAELVSTETLLGQNTFRNMLVEWLAPVEQHGTEFFYLPTWDLHTPTGAPGEKLADKRPAEIVRVYGTSEGATNGIEVSGGGTTTISPAIEVSKFAEFVNIPVQAHYYRTDKPAQATMASARVAVNTSTTGGSGGVTPSYDVIGSSMVTLVPREQWTTFAAVHAPEYPSGMLHFVNVVVDTAHRFNITIDGAPFVMERMIPGTDFAWGTKPLAAGTSHFIRGANGARFSGNVYGTFAGKETFRLTGYQYEEYLGLSYNYPIPGLNLVTGPGDSLLIKTVFSCVSGMSRRLDVSIEAINENPAGLRSVHLENAINAHIASTSPDPLSGAVTARVSVEPIDPLQDASATIVITDKTGQETRLPFSALAEYITTAPTAISFGVMTAGTPATRTVVLTNPLDRPLAISRLRLVFGDQGFTIQPPTLPATIAAHGTITLSVEASPAVSNRQYRDTLVVDLDCSSWKIPLSVETGEPCMGVSDIDFGTLAPGQSKTMALQVCNNGGGLLSFSGAGGVVAQWTRTEFSIPGDELRMLRDTTLNGGECLTLHVTFTASAEGTIRDSARFSSLVNSCDSVSTWSAIVTPPNAVPPTLETISSLGEIEPNPVDATAVIRFSLARGAHATLELFNQRGERVAVLLDEMRSSGPQAIGVDASPLPAGVYHYRLSVGAERLVRSFVRR
jgi:hypothetical protein